MPHNDVTYEELKKLDASCMSLDTCKFERGVDALMRYTCHCGAFCAQLDTCCIDSPHRGEKAERFSPSCRNAYASPSSHYFMVDECASSSSAWQELCEGDAGEDLMSLVPVTSLFTNVTYKNYFCFRCHEASDRYRYWSVKLFGDSEPAVEDTGDFTLQYSKVNRTWLAPIGEGGAFLPVRIAADIPDDIRDLPKQCVPNVISDCPDGWPGDDVRQKCAVYASIIHFERTGGIVSYKNPHCALCNFESLEDMVCVLATDQRTSIKKTFSFTHLLDVNRSDGDRVGEIRKCDNDTVWDPFFKKCRTLQCALPGYVLQNGKCTPS